MIKILYTPLRYHYANPANGFSYEYYHFLDSFLHMKQVDVLEFDWVTFSLKHGKVAMQEMLLQKVKTFKPDLVFFSIFKEEFDKEIIRTISQKTITVNWFCDDLWRFEYAKSWISAFTHVTTVSKSLIPKYKQMGYNHVLFIQFAANPGIFRRLNLPKKFAVSFFGQAHSNRKRMISELKKKGVPLSVWGKGWPSGHINNKKLIEIINQSKININFTATSFGFRFGNILPWFLQPRQIVNPDAFVVNGRFFEIPACGGFMLTSSVPFLEDYFKPGKEIVVFKSLDELAEKAEFYLQHEEERERIAMAGYKRVLREHTYEKRFTELFRRIGLLPGK